MATKVLITKCDNYQPNQVEPAIEKCFELFTIKPGQKVLLKVNALMAADPEQAITTHPALVAAVIKKVKQLGGIPFVGDSPGDSSANIEKVLQKCGFTGLGAEIANFHKESIEVKSKSNKVYRIAKIIFDFDVIINLPKLKTHGMTLYTGAIKNLFGCVPGFGKSRYHFNSPKVSDFAKNIVDFLEIIKPSFNIMDAVDGMEGKGPTVGDKRHLGAIIASTDAVALDAVATDCIGIKPLEVEIIKEAYQRGLGTINPEVIGEKFQEKWKLPVRNIDIVTRYLPNFVTNLLRPIVNQLAIQPQIDQATCKQCLICVNNCPAQTIHQKNGKIEINLSKCIMCFCCHELCPHKAIKLKQSWLAKLLGIGKNES